MPRVEVDGLTINYDVQGEGEPLLLIPYTVRRPRLLCVPAAGLHRALQLHRDRPSRHGRERQAARAVLDRGLRRPGRRLPRRHRDRARPRRGRLARRRRGHAPGRPPPGPRALALVAQRLGHQRSLSEDRRRAVAHARVVAADRRGRGHPGHLPAVLHARDVRRAGRSSWTRWSTSCVAAPPSRWTRSWPRPRRPSRTTRAACCGEIGVPTLITFGARDLVCSHALRRAAQERDRRERAGGLRAPVARRAARGPRDLQPRDARLPAAPALVTPTRDRGRPLRSEHARRRGPWGGYMRAHQKPRRLDGCAASNRGVSTVGSLSPREESRARRLNPSSETTPALGGPTISRK